MHLGRRRLLAAEVEDRALAEQPVGLLAPAPRECVVDHLEHPAPRRARRVQRAALDERLSRAATIAAAAASPTFFTALSPKRIFPSTTAKSRWDEFTSGGSTAISISAQAFTYRGTRSLVFITDEISAAMYSHGWFAFSQAVR